MKDKIPDFLKDQIEKNALRTQKFPDDVKQFMIDYATFYSWGLGEDIRKIFKAMKQHISELPVCSYSGCGNKVYFDANLKLTRGCCRDHSARIASLEKYGVENVFQSMEIKEKIKTTNFENYGGHPTTSESVKTKHRKTMIEKYGVDNAAKSHILNEKKISTLIKKYGDEYGKKSIENITTRMKEKYGVDNPMRVQEFREKSNLTKLEKFGNKNMFLTDYFAEKTKETNIKRYGSLHAPANYTFKEFVWKTGEVSVVQGSEPKVLRELEDAGYTYDEVITDRSLVPSFQYFFDGKTRTYYPDFHIPKENLVIEVKSDWTLEVQLEKNEAKFKAVKDAGFQFRLEVR